VKYHRYNKNYALFYCTTFLIAPCDIYIYGYAESVRICRRSVNGSKFTVDDWKFFLLPWRAVSGEISSIQQELCLILLHHFSCSTM